MNEAEMIGWIVLALITLGTFIAIIIKIMRPINELNISIQKLNDRIENMNTLDDIRDQKLKAHGLRIDDHEIRLTKIETRHDEKMEENKK